MTIDRRKLRWNGWGLVDHAFDLGPSSEAVWSWLATELGCRPLQLNPARKLEDIKLPASALRSRDRAQLVAIAGEAGVSTDRYERAFHSRGKSYADLVRLRAGDLSQIPDAVVYPGSAAAVVEILAWAQAQGVTVIPYGGGSSVVGGVTAKRGPSHRAVVTVDTTRLNAVCELDEISQTATLEAGIYGPALERALGARGYTLGHFPQSFEFSTLGGWIAASGAGQQSNRYGRAADWLVRAQVAMPTGLWRTSGFPATAAGPDLNALVVGSEGTLGIITDATVRMRRCPAAREERAWLFRSFDQGLHAARVLMQEGLPVAMVRLSDAAETRFLSTFSQLRRPPRRVDSLVSRALRVAGFGDGRCMLLLGVEGEVANVKTALARATLVLRANHGFPLGRRAGAAWRKTRFSMPYLRDPMLDRGIGVDTFETATRWSNVAMLHSRVTSVLERVLAEQAADSRARGVVMAHVSHLYEDGASLYFTILFPQAEAGRQVEQWRAIKTAASDAIVSGGGTITHHHGVGTDHAPWIAGEKGTTGMSLLKALKRQMDPQGILNPGKFYR